MPDDSAPIRPICFMVMPNGRADQDAGSPIVPDWAKPLFYVAQARRIPYPLPEGAATSDTAGAVRGALAEKVRAALGGPGRTISRVR